MSWSSKRHYPVDASRTVTVKATEFQKGAWKYAAQKLGIPTPGPFLAWAADMAIALLAAYERVQDERLKEAD